MKEIITPTAKLSFDGKVLVTALQDNIELEKQDVVDNFLASQKLTQGNPYLSLVITAPYTTITKEAREAANRPEYYAHTIAQALVVKTLATRIMGNFIIRLYKNYCPQRLFTSKEEALKWLEKQWIKARVRDKAGQY